MTQFTPQSAADVTEEIVQLAYQIAENRYPNSRIDWDDLLYHLDGTVLEDGRELYMPDDMFAISVCALRGAVTNLRSS